MKYRHGWHGGLVSRRASGCKTTVSQMYAAKNKTVKLLLFGTDPWGVKGK